MRLVRDVAGHNLSVLLDSNHESAAIIAEQCLQIGSFIFGMILLGEHELDRVLACERRALVRGNKHQFRRLIVALENTAYLRVSCRQLYRTYASENDC